MNQHGSNEIIIYIKMPNRIFFFPQGQRSMCPLVTGQMFDIYLPRLLYHIYCDCTAPSDGFVSTPCSEIEQIVCASVWRVIIFCQITVQWCCECNPFCNNTWVDVYLWLTGLHTQL